METSDCSAREQNKVHDCRPMTEWFGGIGLSGNCDLRYLL